MSGVFEPSIVMGHDVWEQRVDAVLKKYRTAENKTAVREEALKELHNLNVPDWAAANWIDGKKA